MTNQPSFYRWTVPGLVFLLSALLASILIWNLEQSRLQKSRAQVANLAGDYVQDLQLRLDRALNTTYVLALQIQQGRQSVADFESLAHAILPLYPSVQELAFAPKGVISSVVPLSGNEAVLGVDLFTHPAQKADAIKARDSGRLVLSGPVKLVQGGVALIGRLPVYKRPQFQGAVQIRKASFWGLVEVLINLPGLLNATDLQKLPTRAYNYELWYNNAETGRRITIAASPQRPGVRAVQHVMQESFATWTLSVKPTRGWGDLPGMTLKITVGFFFSLLLAYLARQWLALRVHRRFLEREVLRRTTQIEVTRQQLQATLQAIPDLMIEYDLEGRILKLQTNQPEWLVMPAEDMIGRKVSDGLPPATSAVIHEALQEAYRNGRSVGKEYSLELPNGIMWFELSVARKEDVVADKPHLIALSRDITARKTAVQALQRLSDVYAALNQCHRDIADSVTDEQLFSRVCRTMVKQTGIQMAWIGLLAKDDPLIRPVARYGAGIEYLDGIIISADDQAIGQGPIGQAIQRNQPVYCQDFLHDPSTMPWHEAGARFGWQAVAALPLSRMGKVIGALGLYVGKVHFFDEGVRNLLQEMAVVVGQAMDRLQHELAHQHDQEHIRQLAFFDGLTGLPNRELLEDRFQHSLSMAQRNNKPLTVMFLDLDNFKNVNDSLGHHIGDMLLIELAIRLKASIRQEDTVARQSGDEFVLILPDMGVDSAAHFAEKLSRKIAKPYQLAGHELVVMASIGIAIYPDNGKTTDTLGRHADAAMYRAKHEGRNTYRFFTKDMQLASARVLKLENALRHAMELGQFFLCYQPQLAISGQHVTGVEVLLRWRHPEMGIISPAEFIPVAENSGQILAIGAWVLRHSVWQLKDWLDQGLPPVTLAVNLSAMQFRDPNLVAAIEQVLEESQFPPYLLELELTESVTMGDPEAAISVMDQLHQQGVKMSIDDFGTGYSSLSYLKRFNASKLKIDQSFVCDIGHDANDEVIVSTIVNLAESLGLVSLAEGVETQQQLDFLRQLGCDEIQGYYFSKPLIAEDFAQYLRDRMTL